MDPRIILSGRGVQLDDPIEVQKNAISMQKMARQNQQEEQDLGEQRAMSDILKKYQSVGPDGRVSVDKGAAMSEMAQQGNGKATFDMQKFLDSQDLNELKAQTEKSKSLLFNASPQNWAEIRAQGIQMGLKNWDKIPEQVNDQMLERMQIATLNGEEQINLRLKEKQIEYDKNKDNQTMDFRRREIEAAEKAAGIKTAQEEYKKTPKGRLEGLNTSDKGRFDNAKLGLQKIQGMDNALAGGDNTFRLVGDNNYTKDLRLAAEAFGRMQSGGAINKEEEERFLEMAPTAKDSKEIQRQKLLDMQQIYTDRLQTLGFTPEEAGVPLQQIKYASDAPKVGQEKDGYVFQGGDPSDESSWRPINSKAQR